MLQFPESVKVSNFFYFFIILSGFLIDAVFRQRDWADKSIDLQIIVKVFTYLSIFFIAIFYINKNRMIFFQKRNGWLFVFFITLLSSSFYSYNLVYSLICVFSIFAYFLFFGVSYSKYGERFVVNAVHVSLILFCMVSIFYYFVIPSVGRISYWEFADFVEGGRMSGIAGSANNLGRIGCLTFFIALWLWKVKYITKKVLVLSLLLSSFCLLMSINRSSILAAFFCSFIIFYNKKYNYIYLYFLILFFVSSTAIFFDLESFFSMISRSGNIDEILTFTGRTYIWDVVLDLVQEKPIIGFGYASSMFFLPEYDDLIGFKASHAHNMFLQVLLYSGILGIFSMLYAFIRFFVDSLGFTRLGLALFFYVIYNGLLESGAFNGVANVTTLALFMAFFSFDERRALQNDYR